MHYRFGDCEVDIARRSLTQCGDIVALEPQVFELLLFLLEHRDRAVTKAEIFERIWEGRAVGDAVLTTRIRSLRQAIDSPCRPSHIRTLHKIGYRFEAEVLTVEETPSQRDIASAVLAETPAASYIPTGRTSPELRPAIAVLPFDNMSSDPELDHFADGLCEDIITLLSKFPQFSVLARNSTFAVRDQGFSVKEIGNRLGARYVLEGSVRSTGVGVRITAQLIDAAEDAHIWADKFDLQADNSIAVQDEVSSTIVTRLIPNFQQSERSRVMHQSPEKLGAWEMYHRGMIVSHTYDPYVQAEAVELMERAIDLDPTLVEPHGSLSFSLATLVAAAASRELDGEAVDLNAYLLRAEQSARTAISLDPNHQLGWSALGRSLLMQHRADEGIEPAQKAVSLAPNRATPHITLGDCLWRAGHAAEAIPQLEKAVDHSQFEPFQWMPMSQMSCALVVLGQYESAVSCARRSGHQTSKSTYPFLGEISALGHIGRIEEARESLERATRVEKNFCLRYIDRAFPITDQRTQDRLYEGLLLAGVSELPSALSDTGF